MSGIVPNVNKQMLSEVENIVDTLKVRLEFGADLYLCGLLVRGWLSRLDIKPIQLRSEVQEGKNLARNELLPGRYGCP